MTETEEQWDESAIDPTRYWHLLDGRSCCGACGESLSGVFTRQPCHWGTRRQPVRLADY